MAKKGAQKENKAPAQIQNRKARFNYHLIDTYEAGIMLAGSEVKSIYLGRANLTDAYCRISAGEIWIENLDIEPYEKAAHYQPERRRVRKLLMHRREIDTLDRKTMEKGLSIIPTSVYFKNGKVKVEVSLARGKAQYDKRESIAKKDERRDIDRAVSGKY